MVETNLSSGTFCYPSTLRLSSTETSPRSHLIHNYHPKLPLIHNCPLVDGEDEEGKNAKSEKHNQDVTNGTFHCTVLPPIHNHQLKDGDKGDGYLGNGTFRNPRLPLIHSY